MPEPTGLFLQQLSGFKVISIPLWLHFKVISALAYIKERSRDTERGVLGAGECFWLSAVVECVHMKGVSALKIIKVILEVNTG